MNPTLRTPHANMEIAVLLGLTGRHPPEPLWSLLPALRPEATTMLGTRRRIARRANRGVDLASGRA